MGSASSFFGQRIPPRHVVETLAIAVVGGFLFNIVGFPAGWFAGAMVASAVAALCGRRVHIAQPLARVCFVTLGISLGAVATPETMRGMGTWPLSVVLVCIAMGLVTLGTVTYLRLVHGWDTRTAVFAGIPGALSQVMAVAAECGCDLRAIAIVQSMRVLILAVCVPGGLALFGMADGTRLAVSALSIADAPGEFAILVGVCVGAALLLMWVRFPGGVIFGPLVISAALHGSGLVHVSLPPWLASIAMVGLGAVAGSRFTGTPFRVVVSYFGAAIGAFAVALTISAAFALAAGYLLSLRTPDVITAYAPGAVDVMMILALAMHLDPVFVGAHHLARFFSVTLALPVIVRYIGPPTVRRTKSGRPIRPQGDGMDD